jgi:hypothetical protein
MAAPPEQSPGPEERSGVSHSTVAIVPAFNEAASVADVVAELRDADATIDIVVIDDGSRDATATVARSAGAAVVRMPFNVGIGGAVQTGYRFALENGYDIAVQVDGDGQHVASEIAKLLEPLLAGQADMAVGTRWREEGDYRAPLARRVGIWLFAHIVSVIVREKVTDTTSGFRAVNRRGICLFAVDYPTDYPEVESTVLAFRHRLRLVEVSVTMRNRSGGSSSINWFRSIYYVVKVTLALFIGLFQKPRMIPEDL